MFTLTPEETDRRLSSDVAAIRRIMGPSHEMQLAGLYVTAFLRGIEQGLRTYANPLGYVQHVRDAEEYGTRLGYRLMFSELLDNGIVVGIG